MPACAAATYFGDLVVYRRGIFPGMRLGEPLLGGDLTRASCCCASSRCSRKLRQTLRDLLADRATLRHVLAEVVTSRRTAARARVFEGMDLAETMRPTSN